MKCLMCIGQNNRAFFMKLKQFFVDLACAHEAGVDIGKTRGLLCKHHDEYVIAHRAVQRSQHESPDRWGDFKLSWTDPEDIPMADILVMETAKKGMK